MQLHWIPVSEQLPDEGVNVLVWLADRARAVVAYRRDKWWDGTDEELNFHSYTKTDDAEAPTHWMPLPEPPGAPVSRPPETRQSLRR
jgi:hypothetical protein